MSNIRNVSLNTFYQICAKAVNAAAGLIILASITRALGTSAVGEYTLIMNYIGLFFVLIDFGANAIIVKQLSQTNQIKGIISKVLTLRLLWSTVLIVLAITIVWLLPTTQSGGYNQQVKYGASIGAIVLIVMAILSTANALFQYKQNYAYQALINLTSATSQVLLTFIAVNSIANVLSIITAYTVASLVGACIALFHLHKLVGNVQVIFDKQYAKNLIVETAPLTITIFTNLIYFRVDSFIIPIYRSMSELGQYNVAYKVFDNLLTIPTFASNAIYPVLLQKQHHQTTLKKAFITYALIASILSMIMTIIAPLITFILTGENIPQVTQYIRILSTGLIFFFISSLTMMIIIIKGQQKHLIWIYGLNMILAIVLNLILVPIYGAIASAWITIALEAAVCLLAGLLLFSKSKIRN